MVRARKARTLVDDVHAAIRADILAGRLAPGEPLRMATLRERFAVSLSVVREALTRLSEQRLVRAVPQLGFAVVPASVDQLHDLTRVRIDVESITLRRAVAEGDQHWETAVTDALRALLAVAAENTGPSENTGPPEDTGPAGDVGPAAAGPAGRDDGASGEAADDERLATLHAAVHAALAGGCSSPLLRDICASLFDAAEIYRHWCARRAGRRPHPAAAVHEDAAICRAAVMRDAEQACSLLSAHIQATTDRLLAGATPRLSLI
jgi:DNA-binding GntR family transcriptional regulator